jgi:hypothetical protein
MFKVGDKVYHIKYGWGIITDYTRALMRVEFTNTVQYFEIDDKLLSFTEYTLQGVSQERPIELPEVGEECLVRDDDEDLWVLKCFMGYYPSLEKPFVTSPRNVYFKQLKRIKILD